MGGRVVSGVSQVFNDILSSNANILFLGYGKSTMLRDVCAQKALSKSVFVVDTKGDLGGLKLQAHASLGFVRRAVCRNVGQKECLANAISNHSPDVLVVDEVYKTEDVEVLKLAKFKKIQILAGSPISSLGDVYQNEPNLLNLFDFVIELESNVVNFRVYDLKRKKLQARVRTEQGVVCAEEVPMSEF